MKSIVINPYIQDIDQILNDLTKGQGYNSQIVSPETKYRDTNDQTKYSLPQLHLPEIARINRGNLGIISDIAWENKALEKAPTHINPACPRLSSPENPTTRFRETAAIV